MKKTVLIALAGMMLFSFTQCGSKEYKAEKAMAKAEKKAIKKAKTCEDLDKNLEKVEDEFYEKYKDVKFEGKQKMTEKEEKKIIELGKEIDKLYDEAEKKLCKDDD